MDKKHTYYNTMKSSISKPIAVLLFFVVCSCNTDETQTVANFTAPVLLEEFNQDGAPNSDIWGYNIGTGDDGWGNNELQYYTDRTENVKVENGYLLITANEESFNGSSYTSARLVTQGNFDQKYGRFEARMRLPFGQGMWPAFWLLGSDIDSNPWPFCGEIDIMENRGSEPTLVSSAVHGPGYSGGNPVLKRYDLGNERVDTDFHIYGIEWGPEYINFYVDDVLYNQITPDDVPGEWVYDHPFFIIINLAVGGNFGGNPNSETVFPQTMLIDYVRVYEQQY